MPIKLIAKEKIRYPFLGPDAREYEPGDEFEIREVDGLAEEKTADALIMNDKAMKAQTDEPVTGKKRYQRRDLRAEDR